MRKQLKQLIIQFEMDKTMKEADEAPQTVGKLIVYDQKGNKKSHLIFEGVNHIGRTLEKNTIWINDSTVSQIHCSLNVGLENTTIMDLGSSNGVFINDLNQQLSSLHQVVIGQNQIIFIGGIKCQFILDKGFIKKKKDFKEMLKREQERNRIVKNEQSANIYEQEFQKMLQKVEQRTKKRINQPKLNKDDKQQKHYFGNSIPHIRVINPDKRQQKDSKIKDSSKKILQIVSDSLSQASNKNIQNMQKDKNQQKAPISISNSSFDISNQQFQLLISHQQNKNTISQLISNSQYNQDQKSKSKKHKLNKNSPSSNHKRNSQDSQQIKGLRKKRISSRQRKSQSKSKSKSKSKKQNNQKYLTQQSQQQSQSQHQSQSQVLDKFNNSQPRAEKYTSESNQSYHSNTSDSEKIYLEQKDKQSHKKYIQLKKGSYFRVQMSGCKGCKVKVPNSLALKVVDRQSLQFDILIMQKFQRTFKLMVSILKGAEILNSRWIRDSILQNKLLRHDKYQIKIPSSLIPSRYEEYHYRGQNILHMSLQKVRQQKFKVFKQYSFVLMSRSYKIDIPALIQLIQLGGGRVIEAKQIKNINCKSNKILPIVSNRQCAQKFKTRQDFKKYYKQQLIYDSILFQDLAFWCYQA